MSIKPLNDRILIQLLPAEEKTKSGIIIPDTAKDESQQAKVVAVGPGKLTKEGSRLPIDVKVDDTILVGKYGGDDFKYQGEEYKIIQAEDVLAIIE